jgi:hypothetical protein
LFSKKDQNNYKEFGCVCLFIFLVPKIRLTNQNAGYIEIQHGSTWKKANEENWEKARRNELCQHLGFEAIESIDVEKRKVQSGEEIVTGDPIFHSTPRGIKTSCIYLNTFTSTESTMIPYVKCKSGLAERNLRWEGG